ncbi:MAG TPA: hypothetical protein DDW90_06410 [Cyanobacteria bacterium UBA9971]|nr:hypothetical protein [Cyanobacteria bacterium UBA9971]
MSAIATIINDKFQDGASFFRIAQSYMRRRNPLLSMVSNTLASIQNFLNSRKQLKALKYRVQLMNYRIYQMDQLIQQNNPQNYKGGNNLNQVR